MQTSVMSNLQLELLRTFTHQISDEDLLAIKKMLADYFAQKAINLADNVWKENNWTGNDTLILSKEHNRKTTSNESSN
jgi:hypothetical protein